MIITYDEPGITYDDPRVTYDGVFTDTSSWPVASDVRSGVRYGPTGDDYTGSALAGSGGTVIAYRSDVQVSTPVLRIAYRPKRCIKSQEQREPAMLRARPVSKHAYSTTTVHLAYSATELNEVFVTTTTESISV